MAGLYVHIPFCRSACHYCDFYFTVDLRRTEELTQSICFELQSRAEELAGQLVETLYFGGGTPSILAADQLLRILETIRQNYHLAEAVEVTLEANPEDLKKSYLQNLISMGFNRLSIGVQSFNDLQLLKLNRKHNGQQAIHAIQESQDSGFQNISIDLMFGLPNSDLHTLESNLSQIFGQDIPHFSAYHLTYETGTILDHQRKKGKVTLVNEEQSLEQFRMIRSMSLDMGYEPYEISNYAQKGKYSQHNTAYWFGVPYVGVGPGAHSYNGKERRWNLSNLYKYINQVNKRQGYWESEKLTEENVYNEIILTRLRTKWGIPAGLIEQRFNPAVISHYEQQKKKLLQSGWLSEKDSGVCLTEDGIFVSDRVISEFFL